MTQETPPLRKTSNAYSIFILVLTILSLAVMVAMLLPLSETTLTMLWFYDTVICIIFLIDFYLNWRAAPRKSDYFIGQRGWLDLLGSIPSHRHVHHGCGCRYHRRPGQYSRQPAGRAIVF